MAYTWAQAVLVTWAATIGLQCTMYHIYNQVVLDVVMTQLVVL